MKKTVILSIIVLATLIFNACRVAPANSQLDAQWQLMAVDIPGQTTIVPTNPRVYYSFYRHTATLTTSSGQSINANLSYVENQSLTLQFNGLTADDIKPWYIETDTENNPKVEFSVIKIDGKQLVLKDNTNLTQYIFRKY